MGPRTRHVRDADCLDLDRPSANQAPFRLHLDVEPEWTLRGQQSLGQKGQRPATPDRRIRGAGAAKSEDHIVVARLERKLDVRRIRQRNFDHGHHERNLHLPSGKSVRGRTDAGMPDRSDAARPVARRGHPSLKSALTERPPGKRCSAQTLRRLRLRLSGVESPCHPVMTGKRLGRGTMQRTFMSSISNTSGAQTRFVAAAKANRPKAWKCVERLKMACALDASFPEWMRFSANAQRRA